MALFIIRLAIALLLLVMPLGAATVLSIQPAAHSMADRGSSISVDLDAAIDPATVTAQSFMVFGRWSGVMTGSFSFENNNSRIVFTPVKAFFAGEQVTINLSKSILNSGGGTPDRGYCWTFMTAVDSGSIELVEVARISTRRPGEGPIQTYGAYGGDLNGDGWPDYFVPNEISNDVRVFLNDQQGGYSNFTVIPLSNAARPSTNEATDFNGDGIIDVAVGNTQNNRVHVMLGNGAGGFTTSTLVASTGVRGLTILDLDSDGAMDIITANRNASNLSIFMGAGDGTFSSATSLEAGGDNETAIVAADANNDGIMDIFVGAIGSSEVILMLGDGQGGLTFSSSVSAGGSPWMIVAADINNDGFVDAAIANSDNATVGVVFGDGAGGLSPAVTYATANTFPIAIDLGDLDGDGDYDMMSSAFGGTWRLHENNGSGVFNQFSDYNASFAASCAVFHDRDNDGIMDVTGIDEIDDMLFLFKNGLTGTEGPGSDAPAAFVLHANYPNPFNPSTRIEYELDRQGSATLQVFDIQGRPVKTLYNGQQSAGSHTAVWDGSDAQGNPVASGIYLYRLRFGDAVQSHKMVLLR